MQSRCQGWCWCTEPTQGAPDFKVCPAQMLTFARTGNWVNWKCKSKAKSLWKSTHSKFRACQQANLEGKGLQQLKYQCREVIQPIVSSFFERRFVCCSLPGALTWPFIQWSWGWWWRNKGGTLERAKLELSSKTRHVLTFKCSFLLTIKARPIFVHHLLVQKRY